VVKSFKFDSNFIGDNKWEMADLEKNHKKNKKLKISIRWQSVIWFSVVFSIVSIVAFQIFASLVIRGTNNILQHGLDQSMQAAVNEIDVDVLLGLAAEGVPNESGFTDDPRFFSLLEYLDSLHTIDPDMWPYLYIESEQEGYVYFVVDLYYLYDQDTSARFMEHYKSNSGYILQGLDGKAYRAVESLSVILIRQLAEEIPFIPIRTALENLADSLSGTWFAPGRDFGTYSDKYGSWASGYMPFQTEPGDPRAAIGIDYKAELVNQMHDTVLIRLRQFFGFSYILGVTSILLFGYRVTNPLISLTEKARFISNNVESTLISRENKSRFRNELNDLEDILVEMVEKIQRRDKRYRAIVSSQADLIVRWKPDGTFTFKNPALIETFGLYSENISNIKLENYLLVDPQKVSNFFQNTLPSLSLEEPFTQFEVGIKMSDDSVRTFDWRVRGIFDQEGNIEEYQAVGRDITQLQKLVAELDYVNKQLEGLSHELIVQRENDQANLARELHDDVLSYISELFMDQTEPSSLAYESYLKVVNKIRETIYALRPPMLSYGLYLALEDFVDGLQDRYGDETEIKFNLEPDQARFDPDVEIQIFRIVQESCGNALSHGQLSTLSITGTITPDQVFIEVEDDGQGFDIDLEGRADTARLVANKKFGLVGMHERAEIIGANLNIHSVIGEGTKISLAWSPKEQRVKR
jgi:PAS domain S-box-containing protein